MTIDMTAQLGFLFVGLVGLLLVAAGAVAFSAWRDARASVPPAATAPPPIARAAAAAATARRPRPTVANAA